MMILEEFMKFWDVVRRIQSSRIVKGRSGGYLHITLVPDGLFHNFGAPISLILQFLWRSEMLIRN